MSDDEAGTATFALYRRQLARSAARGLLVTIVAVSSTVFARATRSGILLVLLLTTLPLASIVARMAIAARAVTPGRRHEILRREARRARIRRKIVRAGVPPFLVVVWLALLAARHHVDAAYDWGNAFITAYLVLMWVVAGPRGTNASRFSE